MSTAVTSPISKSRLSPTLVKLVVAALALLAALDFLSAVLGTVAPRSTQPPAWAIVTLWALGALTLIAIVGLWQGRRWAPPLVYLTRALDLISGLLGLLANDADATRLIEGLIKLALGIAVVVILITAQVRAAGHR